MEEAVRTQSDAAGRMVVDDQFKFVRYSDSETTQLFDLKNDPGESKNLAFDSDHQATCAGLAAAIDETESRLDNVELPAGLGRGTRRD